MQDPAKFHQCITFCPLSSQRITASSLFTWFSNSPRGFFIASPPTYKVISSLDRNLSKKLNAMSNGWKLIKLLGELTLFASHDLRVRGDSQFCRRGRLYQPPAEFRQICGYYGATNRQCFEGKQFFLCWVIPTLCRESSSQKGGGRFR